MTMGDFDQMLAINLHTFTFQSVLESYATRLLMHGVLLVSVEVHTYLFQTNKRHSFAHMSQKGAYAAP